MTTPIFVYGTLKSGHSRNTLLKDQRYLGTASTIPKYKIYRYSSFPALVSDDDGKSIFGELYEVSDSCLVELDEVEGTKFGLFSRGTILLKETTFFSLPLYKRSSDMLMENSAIAYFFVNKEKLSALKDCGNNWTIME
jgi:gamma-glutamylcyclotransferase (GGCT)/AIG2-like uncharacterized protein YtfP